MTDLFTPATPSAAAGPAQLTNMRLAMSTMLDCVDADDGSPQLALFHGPSGFGKSVAAAHIAAHFRAGYIEAKSIWTQRTLLEKIAEEIGVARLARTGPKLLEQIINHLVVDPVPLILDEMDHLVKRQSVEIIRDIHDGARIPILMIGEESLPAKLKEWERFDNRILVRTAAQPATVADALMLRDFYCTRVRIEDDLVEAITAACKGVTRRIVINLHAAQKTAIAMGQGTIDRDGWGQRRFETGDLLTRKAA